MLLYFTPKALRDSWLSASHFAEGDAQPAAKQQEKVLSSALEAFRGKRGHVIMKEFYDLGSISSLGRTELKAIVISEPNSADKIKGLKVEGQEGWLL
jgi:hypothetical protein